VLVAIGAKLVYHDDDHLTRFGAELLRKRLREEVLQALVNDDEASDGHAGVEHLELK
jgi:hypothetical protein